jgi:DNA-binding beta-propeller fold protein YncE
LDINIIDRLARQLAAGVPRRRAAALLVGASVAPLLWPPHDAAAKCKKVGKKCDKNKDCCDGATCKGDSKNKKGKCRCKGSKQECDKECVDLDTDDQHCGACNNVCTVAASCQNGACAEGGYALVTQWGDFGEGDGQFQSLVGIALSTGIQVYTTDNRQNRVQAFDRDGTFLGAFGSSGSDDGELIGASRVAVDADGLVYVTDSTRRVQRFDGAGVFQVAFGEVGGDGQFFGPSGMAFRANGNLVVADTGNHRIATVTSDGDFVTEHGSQGDGNGEFSFPRGVAIAANGDEYVADTENHRIQKFRANGSFLLTWGSEGDGDGQFQEPNDVAIGPDGSVFVADTDNHRIQKFDADGTFLTKWGREGSGDGEFDTPRAMAVDEDGNVYVADTFNNRIQKFAPI